MPRAPRIWFPGAVYHIIQRGNSQQNIFKEDKDRVWFLKTVEETKKEMAFKIYLYVLMDNHYHLTIETSDRHISEIMHSINSTYAIRFNKKYEREGHLFQGRYKGILVDKESYLLELSRYIHLNPVKAGLVDNPADYRWSSYRVYINEEKNYLIETGLILSWFGDAFLDRHERYENFVVEKLSRIKEEGDWLEKHIKRQRFLGDKNFINTVLKGAIKGARPLLGKKVPDPFFT